MRQYLNHFVGKVASFDDAIKYYPNEDENKCLLMLTVNVQKPFKKKEEQYYPTFLKTFKIFGRAAKAAGEVVQKNMDIIAEGYLDMDEDYTDKSGELRKGREFINCRSLEIINSFYSLHDSNTGKINEASKATKSTLNGISGNKPSGLKIGKGLKK